MIETKEHVYFKYYDYLRGEEENVMSKFLKIHRFLKFRSKYARVNNSHIFFSYLASRGIAKNSENPFHRRKINETISIECLTRYTKWVHEHAYYNMCIPVPWAASRRLGLERKTPKSGRLWYIDSTLHLACSLKRLAESPLGFLHTGFWGFELHGDWLTETTGLSYDR